MKTAVLTSPSDLSAFLLRLENRMPGEDPKIRQSVSDVIDEVRRHRERGVRALRERFEGIATDEALVVRPFADAATRELFEKRAAEAPASFRSAMTLAAHRVRNYHLIQKDHDRHYTEPQALPHSSAHPPSTAHSAEGSVTPGQFVSRVQPLDRVAIYVPGGRAFYPSSLIMSLVPAQVAGVPELTVVTPFRSLAHPAFASACLELGVQEILATGGAQGVAAAALGIEGFARCDKIVGPGNAYVATAKHLLSGRIGIDSFAGPSEILILGDGTSPPHWIAADLLAQAEHDEEASAVLVTTSSDEAAAVAAALKESFEQLGDRSAIARESWSRYGAIILVAGEHEQIRIANAIHTEHLHIHTASALTAQGRAAWSQALKGVGAIFFGRYAAEVFGDYVAGPSHVLPTAGTARFASPLGVYDFVRRSSLLWMPEELARSLAPATAAFADAEELWGHARAARLRGSQSENR